MSNETEEGVAEVKTAACDKLLQARVDARMAGKKVRRGARCRFCFGRVCKLGVVPCRVWVPCRVFVLLRFGLLRCFGFGCFFRDWAQSLSVG